MKYAIRLKSKIEEGFKTYLPEVNSTLSEHLGGASAKPMTFNSIAEAEVYAQNYEIHNFNVEPYND